MLPGSQKRLCWVAAHHPPFLTASRLGFRQPEIARFRSRRVAAFQQVKGAPTALVARTQGPGRWNRRGAFDLQKRGRA